MSRGPTDMRASFMDGLDEPPQQDPTATPEPSWLEQVSERFSRADSGYSAAFGQWLIAGAQRSGHPACRVFVADVEYRGGLEWSSVDPAGARYRLLGADGSERRDLGYDDRPEGAEGATIRDLLAPLLRLELPLLASAVWATDSLAALQSRIGELGAVVRYGSDVQGHVQALLVPGAVLAERIGRVASQSQEANSLGVAYDELPDLLGLRRQVMHLDQARLPQPPPSPAYGRFDPRRLLGKWSR